MKCCLQSHGLAWHDITAGKAESLLQKCRQDIKLDIYDWKEAEGQLETKWRVSGIVQLPWRPLLAAAGGTTHVFSQVQHMAIHTGAK